MDNHHKAFRRDQPGGKRAVLFIHGICGSPAFFEPFYDRVPDDWSIRAVLLQGHGATSRDFSKASMAAWKAQVSGVVDELARDHQSLMIVGHSMGTLLAIEQSLRYPENIQGLFLMAVPLRIWPKAIGISHSIRTALDMKTHDDPVLELSKRLYSIQPDRKVWHYWGFIPRYWELLMEMRASRRRILEVKVPLYVFQSKKDEIVSARSAADLLKNPRVRLRLLENSDHKYHPPADQAYLLSEFEAFCRLAP